MNILLMLMLISLPTFAMEIKEVKELAQNHSATLKAHELELQALKYLSKRQRRWQNPQVMGQFGGLSSEGQSGPTAEVSFTQAIPLSNKFGMRGKLGELQERKELQQETFARNWVSHQSQLSAWRLHIYQSLVKHGLERSKRLSLIKKYLEGSPKVSTRQRVELSLVSSSLLELSTEQDKKMSELEMAKEEIEFWTGKKITPEELNLTIPELSTLQLEETINTAQDLDLTLAQADVKASELDLELSRKERRPDLFVGAGYRQEDAGAVNRFSYGIIGLNIPLWDTGSSALEAASARKRKAQYQLIETERKARLRQQKLIQELKYLSATLKRYPLSLIKTYEKAIQEAEVGFKQGILDVNTFLQTETNSHQVIDQVFLSWMMYLETLSELQLLRGQEFTWQ